jgi:putative transposase
VPGTVLDPGPGREFPQLVDAVLADVGIEVVLTGVRMPRMNAIMERWIQTCR